eukprot:5487841-Prymnesium_polylepis.2
MPPPRLVRQRVPLRALREGRTPPPRRAAPLSRGACRVRRRSPTLRSLLFAPTPLTATSLLLTASGPTRCAPWNQPSS